MQRWIRWFNYWASILKSLFLLWLSMDDVRLQVSHLVRELFSHPSLISLKFCCWNYTCQFNFFCSCFNFGKLPQWLTLVMKSVLNCSCFCLELLNSFACHYCHPFCFILFIIQIWQGIQIIFFLSFFCVSQNIWFIEELSKKDKANLKEMVKKFTFYFTIH